MNKMAKMLLQDRRNPYGARGGYVVSGGRRDYNDERDYNYDREHDYNRYRGDMRRDYHDYPLYDMRGDYERRGMSDRAKYYDERGLDYNDYNMGGRDYRRGEYMRRDYGEPEMFTEREMSEWKEMMKNEDGTRGAHFRPEQVKRACEQAGIDCEEFGEDVFCLAMNMMYSDYCKVAKKYGVDSPEFYADMAKAFLRDKDFDGKPEEKLYLYYKTIVEKDD